MTQTETRQDLIDQSLARHREQLLDALRALDRRPAAAARPRLRVTAPTSSLQVQSFMSSPSGVFTDMSGGQLSNPSPATAITGN